MSYQVPYNTASGHRDSQDFYNPYQPQHYTDEQPGDQNQEAIYNNYPPAQRAPTSFGRQDQVNPVRRMNSEFDEGEFPGPGEMAPSGSKSQTLRDYRYNRQGNLCTKGGRVRCIGRICCCSLMTTVFLIVSIVLALALWIRPPSITIGSVQPLSGTSITTTSGGLTVNLGVQLSVTNPNYFSIDFTKIDLELFYPINNTKIGGGNAAIDFKSRSQTNFTFPIDFSYNTSNDEQGVILRDLAAKCGVGGTKSNLDIDYKIFLGIRFLIITIFPEISNSFSFPCPISTADVSQLLAGIE